MPLDRDLLVTERKLSLALFVSDVLVGDLGPVEEHVLFLFVEEPQGRQLLQREDFRKLLLLFVLHYSFDVMVYFLQGAVSQPNRRDFLDFSGSRHFFFFALLFLRCVGCYDGFGLALEIFVFA